MSISNSPLWAGAMAKRGRVVIYEVHMPSTVPRMAEIAELLTDCFGVFGGAQRTVMSEISNARDALVVIALNEGILVGVAFLTWQQGENMLFRGNSVEPMFLLGNFNVSSVAVKEGFREIGIGAGLFHVICEQAFPMLKKQVLLGLREGRFRHLPTDKLFEAEHAVILSPQLVNEAIAYYGRFTAGFSSWGFYKRCSTITDHLGFGSAPGLKDIEWGSLIKTVWWQGTRIVTVDTISFDKEHGVPVQTVGQFVVSEDLPNMLEKFQLLYGAPTKVTPNGWNHFEASAAAGKALHQNMRGILQLPDRVQVETRWDSSSYMLIRVY